MKWSSKAKLSIWTFNKLYTWTWQGYESQLVGGKPAGYLQAWPRISTRSCHEQIQMAVRAGLELGASKLQVQRSNHSATLPANWFVIDNDYSEEFVSLLQLNWLNGLTSENNTTHTPLPLHSKLCFLQVARTAAPHCIGRVGEWLLYFHLFLSMK